MRRNAGIQWNYQTNQFDIDEQIMNNTPDVIRERVANHERNHLQYADIDPMQYWVALQQLSKYEGKKTFWNMAKDIIINTQASSTD